MKKSIKIVALVMVALMICMSFVACGKRLSGKYSADFLGTGTTLTFDGKDVTLALTLAGKELASIDGTYEIKDDKITFDFVDEDKAEDEDFKEILSEWKEAVAFEEGDGYIKIGGVKYTAEEE